MQAGGYMAQAGKWILLLGLWVAWPPLAALACTFLDSRVVYDLLGSSDIHPASELMLPRNVAFVFWNRGSIPQLSAAGAAAPVELEVLGAEPELGRFGLLTPSAPLDPGVEYSFGGTGPFRVADYFDDAAPRPARIVRTTFTASEPDSACGSNSCGESVYIRAQVTGGEDDHTPREALTYVMHVGVTAQAAMMTQGFGRLMLADERGEVDVRLGYEWMERDVFLSISTLDHAGNESARSKPVQVHSGASGCGIARNANFSSFFWVIAAIIWHAASRRRRSVAFMSPQRSLPSPSACGVRAS